jgi:hypothetical protein
MLTIYEDHETMYIILFFFPSRLILICLYMSATYTHFPVSLEFLTLLIARLHLPSLLHCELVRMLNG